jgi:hypothetical protein
MTAANRSERPRSRFDVSIRLHIQQTIHIDVILIEIGVFRMEMMDRSGFTQNLNGAYGSIPATIKWLIKVTPIASHVFSCPKKRIRWYKKPPCKSPSYARLWPFDNFF